MTAAASQLSRADSIAHLSIAKRQEVYASLTEDDLTTLEHDWSFWGRPSQQMPTGDWGVWLLLGGRGSGKTRPMVETVRLWSRDYPRIAIVARTASDIRDTVVEGESGILACSPIDDRPEWEPSKRRLTWRNGAIATTFSADDPDTFRGPQFHKAACDELASWPLVDDAWQNLSLAVRLGDNPQFVVATTPRPIKLIRELMADPHTRVTRMTTYENLHNLAPQFRQRILARYEGTARGRQELLGEVVDEVAGALWALRSIDAGRVKIRPDRIVRIVVAVDPPSGGLARRDMTPEDEEEGAECGIVVAALGDDGDAYILEDCSMRGSPPEWGRAAVDAYHRHRADRIVAEVNNGGQMVAYTILSVDPRVAFSEVWASDGKRARAEPVAALYAPVRAGIRRPRVHHVGAHAELENQMCSWIPTKGRSPDRVDALVWAVSAFYFSDAPAQEVATAVEEEEMVRISPF